jgi:hypothetical protein
MIDSTCANFSSLCKFCKFLDKLVPHLFENIQLLPPLFVPHPNNRVHFVWDKRVNNAIHTFENKMKTNNITSLYEIPLAIYVNIDSTTETLIHSHSFILFIIPNEDGNLVFTMGLGHDAENNKIIIKSPDFNPFIKSKKRISEDESIKLSREPSYNKDVDTYTCKLSRGSFIIKAIEPLTFSYMRNFRSFLYNNFVKLETISTERTDVRSKKKIIQEVNVIHTNINYDRFTFRGENCSSFVENLSSNNKSKSVSSRLLCTNISNPSSLRSKIYDNRNLNDFVNYIFRGDDEKAIEWIIEVYKKKYASKMSISKGGNKSKTRKLHK